MIKILNAVCTLVGVWTIGDIVKDKVTDMITKEVNKRVDERRTTWYEMGYKDGQNGTVK